MNISDEKLYKILEQHERFVFYSDINKIGCSIANLEGVDLSDREFSELELRGGANLCHIKFIYSILWNPRFFGSNLKGASFKRALIDHGWIASANLLGADFSESNLKFSTFDAADLRFATFRFASIFNCTFRSADLRGADFLGAELYGEELDFEGAIYDANTRWSTPDFDPISKGAIFSKEQKIDRLAICEMLYDKSLYEKKNDDNIQYCDNCGRQINSQNKRVKGGCCQGCKEDDFKRFIMLDWFFNGGFLRR